jgi:type I restriction enzyme S subunit
MTKYRFDEIAINSTQKKKPTEEDKVYYIGLEHIDPGCFDVVRWGSDVAPTGDKLLMQKGDVLFGKRRAYQRKVAIAPFDGIFSAHGMVLRPNLKVIDANYFPFFISSDKFMDTAVRISVGGLSPTINWKDLARQEFELPSLDEQKVLAYKLWAAYRLKEAYKKLLVATDEIVKSQFIEMFGDTHMRSDHSRQWKEVVEIINGKDYKSIQVEDGGYPVYGTGGEMARASDYLSPANSILLGRKGTIDKPLLIREKYWNVDTAFGAVPDEKVLHYVYFYWHCKTIDFNVLNKGTTLPSTTKVDLLNLWIKIPSMEEQTRFGSIVEQADKSKFELRKSIDAIDKVIKSLINN